MSENPPPIRWKEERLKKKYARSASDQVNVIVNQIQYTLDSPEREDAFARAMFPTDAEMARYRHYREEWHRRAIEFDPGPAPLAVTCELVSTCDLACTMCYTITEEFQNSVIGAQRMLPWETVTAVIDEAAAIGVHSMLFSWRGESTLYRQRRGDKVYTFADALKYARAKGILEITSLTHGQLIDQAMAEAIVEAEPSWISVSVDGVDDEYNRIRTPANKKGDPTYNAFATVVENVRRLVRIRDAKGKTRPQVRSNTIYPAIARDPEGYRRFLEQIGVGMITVNELLDLRDGDVPEHMRMEHWACQYPFQRLTVSANGIILPCTGAHKEQSGLVLGRYRGSPSKTVRNADGSVADVAVPEMTLAEAWRCEKLENIRTLHRTNRRCEIHPGCRNCNHGVKKFGPNRMPEQWNPEQQSWVGATRVG